MQHDGGDACDLDEGDRQSEQQGPVGFAKARGQVFRVADDRERRAQNRREQPQEDHAQPDRMAKPAQ